MAGALYHFQPRARLGALETPPVGRWQHAVILAEHQQRGLGNAVQAARQARVSHRPQQARRRLLGAHLLHRPLHAVGAVRQCHAAELLRSARRPLIWAGSGVLAAGASTELAQLAELLAAPVFCTMPGKSALPETHRLALGAGATTLAAHRWLKECDVLLALGTKSYAQLLRPGRGAMATYSGATDMIGPAARAFGVSKMSGNYGALAEVLGARGIAVRPAAELEKALADARRLNADGVTVLIDVQTNVESRRSRFS